MTRSRFIPSITLLLLITCESTDPAAVQRHLEGVCDQQEAREEYLDFYWDDLRSHQPELWAQALDTCTQVCPDAVNCGPVLSVASWYRTPPPSPNPERSPN